MQDTGFSITNVKKLPSGLEYDGIKGTLNFCGLPVLYFHDTGDGGPFQVEYHDDAAEAMFKAHIAQHPLEKSTFGGDLLPMNENFFIGLMVEKL